HRAAGDLQDVAWSRVDPFEIGRAQGMNGVGDVSDARLGAAKRDGAGDGGRGRLGHRGLSPSLSPTLSPRRCCRSRANWSNTLASFSRLSPSIAWPAMATRVASPSAFSVIVPRLVCSIAQPSIFTAVTAMLSVDGVLSHGTTSAVMWPCARAKLSMASDTDLGDPLATKLATLSMPELMRENPAATYARLAQWSDQ